MERGEGEGPHLLLHYPPLWLQIMATLFRNPRPAHETKTRSGRGFIAAAQRILVRAPRDLGLQGSMLRLLVQIGAHFEDFGISSKCGPTKVNMTSDIDRDLTMVKMQATDLRF